MEGSAAYAKPGSCRVEHADSITVLVVHGSCPLAVGLAPQAPGANSVYPKVTWCTKA